MGKNDSLEDLSRDSSVELGEYDLDKQLKNAMKRNDIKVALHKYSGSREDFESSLKNYIAIENYKNKNLERTAKTLDYTNKAIMPVDAGLDALGFLGGIGYGAGALVDVFVKLPVYSAYNAYYFGKTHDIYGVLKNIGYEAASWLSPGSLPHLMSHYIGQAENYATEKGSEMFLKGIGEGGSVIEGDSGKKSVGGLEEELGKAA